jgi:D-alanine--poly(phosphoribitol) ligase subunit 1
MAFVSNLGLAFQDIATRFSERIALSYPETKRQVSYAQLWDATERMAQILWGLGLRKGQVVAIFHDKSPEAFATILACLRLGLIYTNLDSESPWERVRKILVNCTPHLIVNAFEKLPFAAEMTQGHVLPVLHLQSLPTSNGFVTLPAAETVQGGTPAYIMFTSGSTGTPKGAVMSHANLLWFIQWSCDRFSITPDDVLTNVNPIYFDNSVFDFYCAFFSGATLVPLTPAQVKDPRQLMRVVEAAKCTIWFSVPSLLVYLLTMRVIGKDSLSNVRKFIFGGEGFPKSKLKQLFDLYGAQADLENVYGPTECTCICSARTIAAEDFEDMKSLPSLGAVAQNFGFEILPVDADNPNFGELLLLGPQVGLGYYRDIERTAKAFIQNPTHRNYADVGYRTGDLVQIDEKGWLHFKGRSDFQIKHMGYRIELEEIESAMGTLFGVKECAVVYHRFSNGLGQIVAFAAITGLVSGETILSGTAAIVPSYMVPKKMVVLETLPKNANGKIDRVALLASL